MLVKLMRITFTFFFFPLPESYLLKIYSTVHGDFLHPVLPLFFLSAYLPFFERKPPSLVKPTSFIDIYSILFK